jgi:glycosyltransferase involved in cell wall biosynthesis
MIGGYEKCYKGVSNIEELGRLDIKDIIPWYQRSQAVIVPSLCDSFPSVIREFAYFGKPIIASNVGAMDEFRKLGMDITIVPPDIEKISAAVADLKNRYRFARQNCLVYKNCFDPNNDSVQERYLRVFYS